MITISTLKDYLGMPPDAADTIAELCLNAAKSKARAAGIPDFQHNAQYDLFLCALSACWYDNRGNTFSGTWSADAPENAQKLINAFVLELRFADEDPEVEEPEEDPIEDPPTEDPEEGVVDG